MIRLLLITDFTESFADKLLTGIIDYSRNKEQWAICRMPPSYKKEIGIPGVVKWARDWGADAVIGQFEETDDVELFRKNGIIVIAQDYKKRFSTIPNITADYFNTGKMAARFFIERGFQNFGFFGHNDVCWSGERRDGFKQELDSAGLGDGFYDYSMQDIDNLWFYEQDKLYEWLRSIPKPVAIMACDDNQGNNLIEACHCARIKVPYEVAVIGVDNDELLCSLGSTTLSSIDAKVRECGYETARLIEALVNDPMAEPHDIVRQPGRIVERLSTAVFATDDVQVSKAINFIHINFQNKISVGDVMEVTALSRRLLERRFKKVTNRSIYQYISELKMRRFKELLHTSDEPVINIALSLGENDTKGISRRFKHLYGYSPNEWREKHR